MGIFSRRSTTRKTDGNTRQGLSIGSTILANSLANAQLLMMTAAERGIMLENDVTQTILNANEAFDKNLVTPEITNSFWHAYETLSQTLSPITIESVRANHDLQRLQTGNGGCLHSRKYAPMSLKSAFRYKLLSLTTLLSLIALQVFWAIGNTLVIDIKEQSDRIIDLEAQLFTESNPTIPMKGSDLAKRLASSEEADGEASSLTNDAAQKNFPISTNTQALNRQIGEYISWRSAEIIELKNWNRLWGRLIFFSQQTWDKSDYEDLSMEAKTHIHYISAQYVLHAISNYFLPILYGLLGASFYVLRQLPKDIENLTFSMNSHIDYGLRITQGPLAGIMASFFFTDAPSKLYSLTSHSSAIATINLESSGLSSFSPLAIAFLAGYSVELIFHVIDKIISTVTNRSTTTVTKADPQSVKAPPSPKPERPSTT